MLTDMSSSISRSQGRKQNPRIGALLRLAWQQVRERIYRKVRSGGHDDLNRAHVAVFRYESLDGLRPTQLAEQMQITKQSINDLLRHLEDRGYVLLRPDPIDRRARLVCLTVRGRQIEAEIRTYARSAEREVSRLLGQRRFREFRETLVKLIELSRANECDEPGDS